jgi:hypothetical protein
VGDSHQMVIDHVGQVVGGEAVGLQQYRIGADVAISRLDPAQKAVLEHRQACQGHLEPDDRRRPFGFPLPALGLAQLPAVPVVADRAAVPALLLLDPGQALRGTVAAVGLAGLDKLFGVLPVQPGPLALNVRRAGPALVRSLIPVETQPGESPVDVLEGFRLVAFPVRVLDAQNEAAPARSGEQVVE